MHHEEIMNRGGLPGELVTALHFVGALSRIALGIDLGKNMDWHQVGQEGCLDSAHPAQPSGRQMKAVIGEVKGRAKIGIARTRDVDGEDDRRAIKGLNKRNMARA